MSQTITDHLDRLLTKPLGFLTNELFIVAMFAIFFFLLSVVTRLAGGHDFGWPFVAGITLSQGLLATLGFLALLDLWVFISLLAALRSGSEPR
jgi:hypothetical protein